jgi:hypothetical protein
MKISKKLQNIIDTQSAALAACGKELATNFYTPSRDIIAMHLGITPEEYRAIGSWQIAQEELQKS